MTEQTAPKKPVFKRLAEVTVALLKIKPDTEYYVKFTGAVHTGAEMPDEVKVDPKTGEVTREARKPAQVAFVVDLEVMAPRQIVVSSVMHSELERAFPGSGYVGKCFGFKSLGKINGKQYNSIEIWQIEEPEGVPTMAVAGMTLDAPKAEVKVESAPEPTEAPKVDPVAAASKKK
jgi:hypothetical protein